MNWEYATYEIATYIPEDLVSELNKIGEEGWELVTVIETTTPFLAIFKREGRASSWTISAGMADREEAHAPGS